MRAVIFDLDGTIVYSHPTHFRAYQKLFREFGIEWTYREFNDVFAGTGAPKIIENILTRHGVKDFDLAALVKKKRDLFNEILRKKSLMTIPGFFRFLNTLRQRGLKKIIASGSSRANIFGMLRNIKVEAEFPEVVSGEEVSRPKPSPDIFLEAARKLGVSPEECIVLEDTEHGVRGAKAAGMKCIALTTTTPRAILKNAGADSIFANYHELIL